MIFQRIWHMITFYHWRHDRREYHKLAMCSCGWKCKTFRKSLKEHLKEINCAHDWEYDHSCGVGPAGGDDSEFTHWPMRQCAKCYKCEFLDSFSNKQRK